MGGSVGTTGPGVPIALISIWIWDSKVFHRRGEGHVHRRGDEAGFEDIEVLRRFDYFSGSSSENSRKVAAGFKAHTIELVMNKQGDEAHVAAGS